MPINKMLKSIIYGFILMLIAAGILYGFSLATRGISGGNSDSAYTETLKTNIGNMRQIQTDEANLIQRWRAGTVDAGTAVGSFADHKARRQQLNTNFFSRAAPKEFTEVHFTLKDSNDIYIEADDLYRDGVFKSNDGLISSADAKAATAKQMFDDAIAQMNTLGVNV
ncbi:MAG: hypothetical protein V1839_03515 [archaeon]